ncbi:hypothetical protein K474DRAFT_1587781 [Panus rudis PR-1116 ss-1]|nr:hypothetical protein K474DRAFT_1587781 [Panus rudis PR-1116 ss-1]
MQVAYGCSGSRSDDTGGIKKAIVSWLSESINASDKPLNPNSKTGRGHHHPVTSELLTPAALLADWTPELQKALLDGNALLDGRPVVPADWPAFLYDGPYNHAAPWVGMLRGKLLVTAFKHIFLSPTSAVLDDSELDSGDGKGTKSGNAARHGMTAVTPASIAYTAAQVHFALTSHHTFSKTNKAIWSKPLYDSIREYFEDESFQDEHDRLLNWWNQYVFPHSHNMI